MPPAPATFSITTLWPRRSVILGARIRTTAWMLAPLDRRQRFEVGGDGAAIFGRELRNVPHHRRHGAADRIAVGQVAGFEDVLDVALRVIADSHRGDVGHPALAAFRIGTAG